MSEIARNIALVLLFVLIGGFFAGTEMALVSLREGQVHSLAQRGKRGARVARLTQDPNRFLSAVQIGMTFATLLSGAFGAETLTGYLAPVLVRIGIPGDAARIVSLIVITLIISYFSLVLGELAPKRMALQRAEGLALLAAPLLDRIARLSRPVIWLLSVSTNLVVRALGGDPRLRRSAMTEDELRDLVSGYSALTPDERTLIDEVFSSRKRQVREVLLPRTEVDFLADDTPVAQAAELAATRPYSRFPVFRGTHDEVIGFVHVRDLFTALGTTDDVGAPGGDAPVASVLRPVKFLPSSKPVLAAMSEMRREGAHLAIVVDEYGGTAGIVTLEDLVEEVVGDIRDEYDVRSQQPRRLLGGVIEVDGLLNTEDFGKETGIELPSGPYETAAGFLMASLGHIPTVGEAVDVGEHRLTVSELDGRRIARIRVTPAPTLVPLEPADDVVAPAPDPSHPAVDS